MDHADYRVYTLLGDGEIKEGQAWEASMLAANHKLDNLVVIVDNNNLQIDGTLEEVNSPYPIDEKFKAFKFLFVRCLAMQAYLVLHEGNTFSFDRPGNNRSRLSLVLTGFLESR